MKRIAFSVALVLAFAIGLCAQNTVNLLNTRYNAESTGNVLALPQSVYWQAGVCQAGTAWGDDWNFDTMATNAPTVECNGASDTVFADFAYDDSATESAYRQFRLPSDWTSTGGIDVNLHWFTTATSGNVVWQLALACVADNESVDPGTFTYNSDQTVTDAAKGTTIYQNTASLTGLTTTGCAAGELAYLRVKRNPAVAGDTLGATAKLIGVEFIYRRAI